MKTISFLLLSILICNTHTFVPAKLLSSTILTIDEFLGGSFGKVSDSLTHEDLTRRGIIQSAVRYFYDQPGGSSKVDLSKIDNEYYNLPRLYYDFYGRSVCDPSLDWLLTSTFQPNVARVDFSSSTKDLPYAHFDAETFSESNTRVKDMTTEIDTAINSGDYDTARKLAGQVMHTIQDFYSHSNHVEMGLTTINELIGTDDFSTLDFITESETNACLENCELVSVPCSTLVSIFSSLLSLIGYDSTITSCPLQYYKCENNISILDKLLSGYYSGQELVDGTPVNKPEGITKCSHGGVLDASSKIEAIGGINKDSGYLVFSPHASLHTKAANLAIEHTQYYFNQIRVRLGDAKFNNFLDLTVSEVALSALPFAYTCSGSRFTINSGLFLLSLLTLIFNFNRIFY